MPTPLYNTDIIPITSRPILTVMDDGDYFVILDTSTGKISKILKTNVMTALKITYDNTSGLTAETVQAALDELVVNLGSSDDAILALSGRLDTLEGEGEGSVAKAIDDAVSPIAEVVDTNRLYSDSQYLELKAKYNAQQIALNASKAELYTDDPILQYGAVEIIGDGYEANGTPIDVSANVVDGKLSMEQKGLTIRNEVGSDTSKWRNYSGTTIGIIEGNLISTGNGDSAYPRFYYATGNFAVGDRVYCEVRVRVLNSECSRIEVNASIYSSSISGSSLINSPVENQWYIVRSVREITGITALHYPFIVHEYAAASTALGKQLEVDLEYGVRWYNLTALGLDHITDTDTLAQLLPYVDGTKAVGKTGVQILDAGDAVTQTIFLPTIGNSLPNGVADSIKTVDDGWEHTKRVYTPEAVLSGVAVNTTNYPTAKNGGQWVNELTSGGTEIGVVGTDSTTGAGMLRFELATPVVTHYDLPHLTSGKTIHRFAGEEKIALYGTGLTFSENVLSVLSAVKFVSGVMTDITSLATITTNTVTFSGVSATDVVYVKVEHSVNRPLGILEHTPAVSNTASRLAAIEAWIAAQGA